MKFIIKYQHQHNFSDDVTPIEYKSKEQLIKNFKQAWEKEQYSFTFMTIYFFKIDFENYEFLTLEEWFERYKVSLK